MANPYLFTTKFNPDGPDDITTATSGGTITGASGVVELVYDDAVFTGAVGKKVLITAVETILNKLKEGSTTWPLS